MTDKNLRLQSGQRSGSEHRTRYGTGDFTEEDAHGMTRDTHPDEMSCSSSVMRAFEKRIDKLEREKALLSEKTSKSATKAQSQSECMELSLQFLANP